MKFQEVRRLESRRAVIRRSRGPRGQERRVRDLPEEIQSLASYKILKKFCQGDAKDDKKDADQRTPDSEEQSGHGGMPVYGGRVGRPTP